MSDNNTNDIKVTEEIRELADFLREFADANDGGEFETEQCEKLRKAADALLVLDAAVTTLTKENAEQHGIHPLCNNSRLHEEEEKSDSDPLTGIQYGDLT
jgi:stalled ribosome rescue protein Dom34